MSISNWLPEMAGIQVSWFEQNKIFIIVLWAYKRAMNIKFTALLQFGGGEGTCASNVSIGTDYILNSAVSRVPRRVIGINYPEPSAPMLPILVDHRTGFASMFPRSLWVDTRLLSFLTYLSVLPSACRAAFAALPPVTVSPIKPGFHLPVARQGDSFCYGIAKAIAKS